MGGQSVNEQSRKSKKNDAKKQHVKKGSGQLQTPVSAKLSTVCNTYNVYNSPIASSNQLNKQLSYEDQNVDGSGDKPFYQLNDAQSDVPTASSSASKTFLPHPDYDADSAAVLYSTLQMMDQTLAAAASVWPSSGDVTNNPAPVANSNVAPQHNSEHTSQPLHAPRSGPIELINTSHSSLHEQTAPPSSLNPAMIPQAWHANVPTPAPTSNEERVMLKYLPWCVNADTAPAISELTPYFAQFWDSFTPVSGADAKIARQVAVGLMKSAIIFKEGRGETVDLQLQIMLNLMKNLQNFE